MITLEALVDMPWKDLKKGDTYTVPNLLGVARCEIQLKQAAVVGGKTPAAAPAKAKEEAPKEEPKEETAAEEPAAEETEDKPKPKLRRRAKSKTAE